MISSHYVFCYAWAAFLVSPSNIAAGAFTTVFAFYRSQLCLPCLVLFGLRQLVLEWLRSVGQLRNCGMPSFFWCLFSKVCPASDSWGWVKNTIRHQRVCICSCLHESKSLGNRWEGSQMKWDTAYWTHLSKKSVRKAEYSFTVVRCDAMLIPFQQLPTGPSGSHLVFLSSCLLLFLFSFLSPSFMQFFLLVQQSGTDGYVLRLWPHAQKRGLQETGHRRDRAGGKAPGGASTNTAQCPWHLFFVEW